MNIAIIVLLGFILDCIWGDPEYRWHPVRLFGKWISYLDTRLYKWENKHLAGLTLWICAIALPLMLWHVTIALVPDRVEIFLSVLLCYSLFSCRDLIVHFAKVKKSVEDENLVDARKNVSMIVGRETDKLNLSQCATAAIESLGENSSDGGISPIFWALVGGIPGLIIFKVTSTLDSMVGYKNERYMQFGMFSAKADDLLNFVPARLTAWGILLVGKVSGDKLSRFQRDRNNHSSPNAGQVEAALAVAVHCKMGGGNWYKGVWVDKPYINAEGDNASVSTMEKAENIIVKLYIAVGTFLGITAVLTLRETLMKMLEWIIS